MIVWLIAVAATAVPAGPGLRLIGHGSDGNPIIAALDRDGKVATRITCLRSQWTNSDDTAGKVLASIDIMAAVVATNGHLISLEQLGPRKYDCVLVPPNGH